MARTRTPTRPAVRLRAVPPLDPPYDDELTLVTWFRDSGDQLELDFAAADPARGAPGGDRHRPLGHPDAAQPAPGPVAGPSPQAVVVATPEAQRATRRFLATCLEILNGYRPVAHARALTTPGLAMGLVEQLRAATDRLPRSVRPGQPAAERLRLLSLRVCEPRPGVAEAAAAIGTAGRTWALAFRLEHHRGRWIAVLASLV